MNECWTWTSRSSTGTTSPLAAMASASPQTCGISARVDAAHHDVLQVTHALVAQPPQAHGDGDVAVGDCGGNVSNMTSSAIFSPAAVNCWAISNATRPPARVAAEHVRAFGLDLADLGEVRGRHLLDRAVGPGLAVDAA